jgi:hypothetical protein
MRGDSSVRIIRDDVEITGQGWTYDHARKRFPSLATCG